MKNSIRAPTLIDRTLSVGYRVCCFFCTQPSLSTCMYIYIYMYTYRFSRGSVCQRLQLETLRHSEKHGPIDQHKVATKGCLIEPCGYLSWEQWSVCRPLSHFKGRCHCLMTGCPLPDSPTGVQIRQEDRFISFFYCHKLGETSDQLI